MTLHQNTDMTPTHPHGFALPRDPKMALEETIRTIEHLHNVYERETAALESSDTRAFLSLQQEKLETAMRYQKSIEEIKDRREEMRGVSPNVKDKLRQMQSDFSNLAQKNKEALNLMQRTVERLGNTIRSAAKDVAMKKRATSYGHNGMLDKGEKKSVSMGVIETA